MVVPGASLIKKKQDPPRLTITYTDSNGNSATTLAALHDGNKTSGGVEY